MVAVSARFITENLQEGKKVLEAFNKCFPNVESPSMVQLRASMTKDPIMKQNLMQKLEELDSRLNLLRKDVYTSLKPNDPFSNYVRDLKLAIKKYNVADCGHRTDVVIGSLNKDGRNAQKIEMIVLDSAGKQKANHLFPVMGMKKGANIDKPETWGDNAVIVDAWANFVMKAQEGLDYIKQFTGFNAQKEKIRFIGRSQ